MSNRNWFRSRYQGRSYERVRVVKQRPNYSAIKRDIALGNYRGYTITRLVMESGYSRHQLRHANITTLTLARGEMDFRLRNVDLANIWKLDASTVRNRRNKKYRPHKPNWFGNPNHPDYIKALVEETAKATRVFKMFSSTQGEVE